MATLYEIAQEEWENDVSGAFLDGKDEGIAEGVERGRYEGRINGLVLSATILRALRDNESVEKISERYNVPISQIDQLRLAL